jgi:hypothetical protein
VGWRGFQTLLIVSTAAVSWLGMMAAHECGHVLHAWFSGGKVADVILFPLAISRTDVWPNPYPLLVAWGGAIWGCAIPLAALAVARLLAPRYAWLARWFAGFCLIANGGYLLGGSFLSGGTADDGGVLLAYGASRWQLAAFGLPAIAAGLYLWNGMGPRFGQGEAKGKVDRRAALGVFMLLVAVLAVELLFAHP